MRRLTLIALLIALTAGIALSAGDTLDITVYDCLYHSTVVESAHVYLDSAGTLLDSVYTDANGDCELVVFPAIDYRITADFASRSDYVDIDTVHYMYPAGDSSRATLSMCAVKPAWYPRVVIWDSESDPTVDYADTVIYALTSSNGSDTIWLDTVDTYGKGALPDTVMDVLSTGTTYRIYSDDPEAYWTDRYWSMVYDTGLVFLSKLAPAPAISIDTLTVRILDPYTNKPPTVSKTLTARWWALSSTGRTIADTSGSNYYIPITSSQSWASNQDGLIQMIVPTGTCWEISIANTAFSAERWCIDSTWAIQTYAPTN